MVALPCLGCGKVTTRGSRCGPCQATWDTQHERTRGTRTQRGYGNDWLRLSKQAIAHQPWCSQCGTSEDLTADHLVPLAAGGTSTPENVQVLCRRCNSGKGATHRG
jgi:5-methylcytosine-specific restriction enzyme A